MSILCTSTRRLLAVAALVVVSLLLAVTATEAYTTSNDLRLLSNNGARAPRKIWNAPSPTTSAGPPLADAKAGGAPKMLKRASSGSERDGRPRGAGWKLSQAAINTDAGFASSPRGGSSSAPPRAAHGILSPETVRRMDEITMGGNGNEAVRLFLQTYRQRGPMSCLEMLSDPDVLPHLTQAMRDIV
jgi:hypothetical protein